MVFKIQSKFTTRKSTSASIQIHNINNTATCKNISSYHLCLIYNLFYCTVFMYDLCDFKHTMSRLLLNKNMRWLNNIITNRRLWMPYPWAHPSLYVAGCTFGNEILSKVFSKVICDVFRTIKMSGCGRKWKQENFLECQQKFPVHVDKLNISKQTAAETSDTCCNSA